MHKQIFHDVILEDIDISINMLWNVIAQVIIAQVYMNFYNIIVVFVIESDDIVIKVKM